MDTTTHEKFAASLFRSAGIPVNVNLIKNVNHAIDNDTIMGIALSNFVNKRNKLNGGSMLKNPYDMFGLVAGGGHRSRGHDMLSGLLMAAMNARAMRVPASHAMMATMAHYASDSMSNRMVNKMGVEGRNIFEAMFNYQTRKNQNKSIF